MPHTTPKDTSLSSWWNAHLPERTSFTEKLHSVCGGKGLLLPPLPGEEKRPVFASPWKIREQIDLRQKGHYPIGLLRRAAIHLRSENPEVVGFFGVVLKFEINSLISERFHARSDEHVEKLRTGFHKLVDQDTYYKELGKLLVKVASYTGNEKRRNRTVSVDIRARAASIVQNLSKEDFATFQTSKFFSVDVARALQTLRE